MRVEVGADEIRVGERFAVAFQRTLRVPTDGREYPLPPGLGRLPVRETARDGIVIPLHRREALWLAFAGTWWKPNAVQVGVGAVNALTGGPWDDGLSAEPQSYLVTPHQPWLDGIVTGDGSVRQFVAVPLGARETVEEQLASGLATGGLRLRVFDPRPGLFPEAEPEREPSPAGAPMASPGLGLGAGGAIRQKVFRDPHGLATWDTSTATEVVVRLLDAADYALATGEEAPPTPVDAATYTEHGLPWFELDDESVAAIGGSAELAGVEPVRIEGDEPLEIDPRQTRTITPPADAA